MTDLELMILRKINENRNSNYCPKKSDFENKISDEQIAIICIKLKDAKLIDAIIRHGENNIYKFLNVTITPLGKSIIESL